MNRLSVLTIILSGLVMGSATTVWAAPPRVESAYGATVRQVLEPKDPDTHFNKAHKDFLDNNTARAAAEIQKGADLIRGQAVMAKEPAKRFLLDAADELDRLSERVALGLVSSDQDLRAVFAHAHQALAGHYHERAASSWAKKLAKEVGKALGLAATHLERGWYWSGRRLTAGAQQVIASAKKLEDKINKGVNWVSREVDESIYDTGKAIGMSKTPEKQSQ